MRNFFIGVIFFGLIIYLTSFSTKDDDELYQNYLEKKERNEKPNSTEFLVYWIRRAVSMSGSIIIFGIIGLVFYYFFK